MSNRKEGYLVKLKFMTEKIGGHGEDAPPLLVVKENDIAVGVFDGMGGAGAATCTSKFGENLTKAYVASRIIEEELELIFEDSLGKEYISPEFLKEKFIERLIHEQKAFPPKSKSLLRSKLVRDYPTTMAVVALRQVENEFQIDVFWAGDSHCYLWTKKGFFQISKDDLEGEDDPMENLRNDAAISNCICADRDFQINHKQIVVPNDPVAILSATDGCFGYFPSPMHFENMLKKSLKRAKNEDDWEKIIVQQILDVTGDDASLSLVGIGFNSFDKFKIAMTTNSVSLIGKLQNIEEAIASQKKKLEKLQNEYEQTINKGWNEYKRKYLHYLEQDNNGNAER